MFLDLLKSSLEFFHIELTILVLVQKGEDSSDTVFGSNFTDGFGSDLKELLEFDGSVGFFKLVDNTHDKWVSSFDSQFLEDLVDFSGINGSTSVFVENFEGLLEIFVVFWVKSVFPVGKGWFWADL